MNGIPDHLNDQHYINVGKRNILVFDDLMTGAKCDQRIADLFTKGSHHRNISIVHLTQNIFPKGKACRDIILNHSIWCCLIIQLIYYMEKCPLSTSLMNTVERLHRNSHLSVLLAITEVIRLYKPELNKILVDRKRKEKVRMTSPITQETEMIQGPDDSFQKTKTAKMEDLSELE